MSVLVEQALAGDRLSLSRILSHVENNTPDAFSILEDLYPRTGKAHLIGVTGSPGTGKSSLVNQLALAYRKIGLRVAIIAVDPSSPFSGGAILGDRIRMKDLSGDAGVFIRSLASRGSLGGLSMATANVARVFDALGFEKILIETVGAGQSEVEIASLAHTTLVVEAPGMGDDIQAIKAGILEIADILVINKADRDGAEQTESALRAMLELDHPKRFVRHHNEIVPVTSPSVEPAAYYNGWMTPIIKTVATTGDNVGMLVSSIDDHHNHLHTTGEWAERDRGILAHEIETILRQELLRSFISNIPPNALTLVLEGVEHRKWSPQQAVQKLINGTR